MVEVQRSQKGSRWCRAKTQNHQYLTNSCQAGTRLVHLATAGLQSRHSIFLAQPVGTKLAHGKRVGAACCARGASPKLLLDEPQLGLADAATAGCQRLYCLSSRHPIVQQSSHLVLIHILQSGTEAKPACL